MSVKFIALPPCSEGFEFVSGELDSFWLIDCVRDGTPGTVGKHPLASPVDDDVIGEVFVSASFMLQNLSV
jgi:hypothetical protein